MIIELGLTGSDRKELAKAVSEIIGAPAEYQYMHRRPRQRKVRTGNPDFEIREH